MKKNIFITGCGRIHRFPFGKKLCGKRGDNVMGYDNLTIITTPVKRERVEELKKIGVTITQAISMTGGIIAGESKCVSTTHLVHLAAQAGVRYSVTNPEAYLQSNLEGFLHMLEVCRTFSLPLIYASSSSVYGLNERYRFAQPIKPDRPTSLYGATKKANELMAHAYHHLYGFPVTGCASSRSMALGGGPTWRTTRLPIDPAGKADRNFQPRGNAARFYLH